MLYSQYAQLARTVLGLCLLMILTLPAGAEPTVITNGSEPLEGLHTLDMEELWRAGGEDDDVFFGTVGAVRQHSDKHIYLLDSQLAEVHEFSPDGELLRTLGGEGDGPGETRRPSTMFLAEDGTVCVLQGFPGRIVKIGPDGTPAGQTNYSTADGQEGAFVVLISGQTDGDGMLLGGIRMGFTGSVSQQTYFLDRCDADAVQRVALLEKDHEIDYSALIMDEGEMDFVWNRQARGPSGRIYLAPPRDEYLIRVCEPDGQIHHIIKRELVTPPRTDAQRVVARQILEAIAVNYPAPPQEITIEETEMVIGNMTAMAEDYLWVQTSDSRTDLPDGCWVKLDVFDAEGRFERQVALEGDHNAERDALFLLSNDRAVVVVGALDAFLNQQGAAGGDAEINEDAEPLEVICYKMETF